MLEYCSLPHLRPFYNEVCCYLASAKWYLREVQETYHPLVSYPTTQEVVSSIQTDRRQAVILRDGSVHVNWGTGVWKPCENEVPAISIFLEEPALFIECNDGSEIHVFLLG